MLSKIFTRPAVFLDRDGVINYEKGYVHKIKDFKFRPNVIKGLKFLRSKNYYSYKKFVPRIKKDIFTKAQK